MCEWTDRVRAVVAMVVCACVLAVDLRQLPDTKQSSYLPEFESVPPPLVYFHQESEGGAGTGGAPGSGPRQVGCVAWPRGASVSLYSSGSASRGSLGAHQPLHPLDASMTYGGAPGVSGGAPGVSGGSSDTEGFLQLRTSEQVRRLARMDLHCLAKTNFGAVISRPFRVIEAKIGTFPTGSGMSSGEAAKVVTEFLSGNQAFVNCDPPESHPPAKVEFSLNGTIINPSSRHVVIKRPNSRRVTLLIKSFEPKDQGYYRCVATNPITMESKTDPLLQQLKVIIPKSDTAATVRLSISGKEFKPGTGPSLRPDEITVRQGTNVTLFCVMQGAPPPHVTIYKTRTVSTKSQQRHVSDKDLGLLTIYNVSPDDEGSYSCSETSASDTVYLKVQKRLGITQGPKDIKVNSLRTEARFTCLSSDTNITPQWYFNGKLRTQSVQTGKDSSLLIENVRQEDLGVYQCVARSQDEWVTHVATLTLKDEPLISKRERNKQESSKDSDKPTLSNTNNEPRGSRIKKNDKLNAPSVRTIGDNLAALLKWNTAADIGVVKHYKVQYRSRKVDSDVNSWQAIVTLDKEISENYFYVTNTYIKAQHVYQFKIAALLLSSVDRYSGWSEEISFGHVYLAGPVLQRAVAANSTHIYLSWKYSAMNSSPITCFNVLFRNSRQEGPKLIYSPFSRIHIPDPNRTEIYIGPVTPGNNYQVVVYGIYEAADRKITQYSAEGYVSMPSVTTPVSDWSQKNTSEANTKLMFIILGSLAGLMMLVIVVLVLMCYCRERKSIVRLNRYKDPAKLIHSDPSKAAHSSFLLASISAAANNHSQQQKNAPDGSMERASLLGANGDQVYCQQKRQPPSGGSGHDMSEEASIHDGSGAQDATNSLSGHTLGQTGMMTPQPPAVTYYKIAPGPASLPAGSLLRQNSSQMHPQAQYCQPQYAPLPQQMYYTGNGFVYPSCGFMNPMVASQQMTGGQHLGPSQQHQQQMQQIQQMQMKQDFNDMRSQDGGESVYSYFSQTSNAGVPRHDAHGTVEAGSQTINSNGTGSASHRHHRRKRRKTNHSGVTMLSENSDNCSPHPVKMVPRMGYPCGGEIPPQLIGREVMYDTPPSGHDPRIMMAPPGMVLVQPGGMGHPGIGGGNVGVGPGMGHSAEQGWAHLNNTLTRRGTPTLFVEPPRIRDYSEYGIPPNQQQHHPHPHQHQSMAAVSPQHQSMQPIPHQHPQSMHQQQQHQQQQQQQGHPHQQLAHLSQQNLHLHNQNLSGGYHRGDVQG